MTHGKERQKEKRIVSALGQRVRALRKKERLTQDELSRLARIDQSYISQIENDHVVSIGSEKLSSLAKALNTTTDYLLGLSFIPGAADQTVTPSTELEWELLDLLRKLPEETQRLVIAMAELIEEHGQVIPEIGESEREKAT